MTSSYTEPGTCELAQDRTGTHSTCRMRPPPTTSSAPIRARKPYPTESPRRMALPRSGYQQAGLKTKFIPTPRTAQRTRLQMHHGRCTTPTPSQSGVARAGARDYHVDECRNRYAGSIRFHLTGFTSYLTLSSKCFATFPHGTCSLSVS
jgi:hypothetical protein